LNSAPAGVTLVGVPATIRRKDEHEAAS